MSIATGLYLLRHRLCSFLGHMWGPPDPEVVSRYLLSETRTCRWCHRSESRVVGVPRR